MAEWSVRLEAEGALTPDEVDDLLEKLAPYGAVGSPGTERVSVRLTVKAVTFIHALSLAQDAVAEAGFPDGRVVAVEAEEVQE